MDEQETGRDPHEEEAEARRQRDRDDFDNEIAGGETGRMRRFLRDDQTPKAAQSREQERERRARAALATQIQLQQFTARLEELDRASLAALRASERQAQEAEERLDRLRESATRDAQGRLVYRTQDGRTAFYDDATQVARDDFERIQWKAGAPTWEQRQRVGGEYRQAIEQREAIRDYRERLQHAQDRVGGGEPLTADELKALEDGAENMPAGVRRALNAAQPTRTSAAGQYQDDQNFTGAPVAAQAFNDACTGGPEAPCSPDTQAAPATKPKTAPVSTR